MLIVGCVGLTLNIISAGFLHGMWDTWNISNRRLMLSGGIQSMTMMGRKRTLAHLLK
jgi:hypothetical protein